ncbi:hypothetical protein GBA52_022986 [Prunus armeniaca]|nr:hypothetical protein GBA52_022986 [Prunus armeniaca]
MAILIYYMCPNTSDSAAAEHVTGIVKMKEDMWKDFNDSLKLTLKRNYIRAFPVEEALETHQECDVMAFLNEEDDAIGFGVSAANDALPMTLP